ncbi:MAG: sugar transferase [Chloroflexi bacterium]|nr:sugar transferase [Chloroflexota bacterium]
MYEWGKGTALPNGNIDGILFVFPGTPRSCHTLKRSFDLAISFIGIMAASPLLILISIWIKLDSRGPVFYRGARVGLHGKPFRIYKFRSMVINAERLGGPSTAGDDPRITRAGLFIRRYKLDELPQLINVLKGEMSLVGPRPEVKLYVDMYTEEEKAILELRPGITDWASLWNPDEGAVLAGSPDPEKTYLEVIRPEKIRLQLRYARERSFWVDIKILMATLLTVLGKQPKNTVLASLKRD